MGKPEADGGYWDKFCKLHHGWSFWGVGLWPKQGNNVIGLAVVCVLLLEHHLSVKRYLANLLQKSEKFLVEVPTILVENAYVINGVPFFGNVTLPICPIQR